MPSAFPVAPMAGQGARGRAARFVLLWALPWEAGGRYHQQLKCYHTLSTELRFSECGSRPFMLKYTLPYITHSHIFRQTCFLIRIIPVCKNAEDAKEAN